MKKITAFFLTLLATALFPGGVLAADSPERAELPSINLLQKKNPGFENGKAGWSASGGSLTIVTNGANLFVPGFASAVWDASASSQTLCSALVPVGTFSNGSATIYAKTTATDYLLQVRDSTNAVKSSFTIPASTKFEPVSVTYGMPDSGTIKLCVVSQSNAAAVALDNAHLGKSPDVQLSQANYFGGITYPRALNCNWSLGTTATFQGFAADAQCTGAVTRGNALTPATLIPAIKFASMPAGMYVFKIPQGILNNSSTAVMEWRLSDGTNHTTRGKLYFAGNNSSIGGDFVLHVTTPLSNATFEVQAADDAATQAAEINNDTASSTLYPDFSIDVLYYPTATATAQTFDTVANSWTGYHADDCQWTVTSTSYVDPAVDASCTLNQRENTNFGTVTSYNDGTPGNNLPGITFTPRRAGKYKVCANTSLNHNTTAQAIGVKLWDGTKVVAEGGHLENTGAGNSGNTVPICGDYVATSTNPVSLRMQMLTTTGAGTSSITPLGSGIGSVIEWSIYQIDQQVPAPLVKGGVVSSYPGVWKEVNISFAGNSSGTAACTSDPCVIFRDYSGGAVTAVNRIAGGLYDVVFAAGTFSQPPVCQFTNTDIVASTSASHDGTPTTTTSARVTVWTAAGAQVDDGAHVSCKGPQ